MFCATLDLMANKYPTSFRLSKDALALLRSCAKKLGISQVAVLEMAIREFVKSKNGLERGIVCREKSKS